MGSDTGLVMESNVELNNKIADLSSQIKLIDYVIEYMKTNNDLIPASLGMLNETTSQNTLNYNRLVLERNRLLKGANEDNPILINLNDQILRLRESIDQSLRNSRSSLAITLEETRDAGKEVVFPNIFSPEKRKRDHGYKASATDR